MPRKTRKGVSDQEEFRIEGQCPCWNTKAETLRGTSWLILSVLYFFLLYPFDPSLPRMCSLKALLFAALIRAPTSLGHSHFSALRNKWPTDEGKLWFVRKQWYSWPSNWRSLCIKSMWVWGSTFDQSWSKDLQDPRTSLKSSEHPAWSSPLLCMH